MCNSQPFQFKEGTRMEYGYFWGKQVGTVQNPKQGNDNVC